MRLPTSTGWLNAQLRLTGRLFFSALGTDQFRRRNNVMIAIFITNDRYGKTAC
jgi:hypothetical protein